MKPYFFHKYWNSLGVRCMILSVKVSLRVNSTLIVLIPKNERPESSKHFWPITLCNVVYKIITKVLVNRLKGCLNKLVNHLQASFIPGLHASNNIIVAEEMIHSIRKCMAKKGGLLVKLGLEQAYDWVSWDFLLDTLCLFGFSEVTRRLSNNCISTSTLAVL